MAEPVKGFFRRATQRFRERGQHEVLDPVFEARWNEVQNADRIVSRLQVACKSFSTHVSGLVSSLDAISTCIRDLAMMSNIEESLSAVCRDTACALAGDAVVMQQIADEEVATTTQGFSRSCAKVKTSVQGREKVRLELEFFRRKVADLESREAADGARLPRNRAILEDWENRYRQVHDEVDDVITAALNERNALTGNIIQRLEWMVGTTAAAVNRATVIPRTSGYQPPIVGTGPMSESCAHFHVPQAKPPPFSDAPSYQPPSVVAPKGFDRASESPNTAKPPGLATSGSDFARGSPTEHSQSIDHHEQSVERDDDDPSTPPLPFAAGSSHTTEFSPPIEDPSYSFS